MFRKIIVLGATLGVFFCACKKEREAHLSQERMQQVLLDVHLAETYSMALHPDSIKRNIERNSDSLAAFYLYIFDHHKISRAVFEESLDWYMQHPQELDSIYARMIADIGKFQAAYE